MDDERLKQICHFGKDYFEELLERIREIRVSERRFYIKKTLFPLIMIKQMKQHKIFLQQFKTNFIGQ